MRTQHTGTTKRGQSVRRLIISTVLTLSLGAGMATAQDVVIRTRPLTPQEINTLGLPANTQIGSGVHAVGIGQPVYLETLVDVDIDVGTNQVVWSIDGVRNPIDGAMTSGSTFLPSPITNGVPPYDGGDAADYMVVDRKVLIPDTNATYDISVEVESVSEGTLSAQSIVVGSVFLGKDHSLCVLCHADKQPDFDMTHHADTFEDQITAGDSGHFQPFCIACHSVGFDATPGAVNAGFDDVAADTGWVFPPTLSPTNWDAMPPELQAKSNVQCENCHGPADEHMRSLGDTDRVGVTLSAGNCGQCHDRLGHHVKNTEWTTAAHSSGYVFRDGGSCAQCHSTLGFIDTHDPDYADEEFEPRGTGNEGITCAACHDPHGPGSGVHQVRLIESVTLENGDVITDGGNGLVCMACHHDRRNAEEYVLTRSRGPHHGTQADMLFGKNAIEYSQDMPSSKHWDVVEHTCVQCHMQEAPDDLPAYAEHKVGGHTFTLSYDDGTNDVVHLTETCTSCHGDLEDFNFGGADYDQDGMVEGVQQEIADMMYDLALLLPPYGIDEVETDDISNTSPEDLDLRKGAYNYLFVEDDGSYGVHNPKYAAALLRSSIDDLRGGIDVDRDGLLDWYEIMHFGDLTSQTGADDWDGDGLNNATEFNLGTKPKSEDSDGDGYWDRAEVEGGSDPLDMNSVPDPEIVSIAPAVELGYLSTNAGSLLQFQSIDALDGAGGWMNTGPAHTNTGDWVFQLETLREATNRFYRVSEE